MSDRGLPRGFRHVNGYGSHAYSFLNAKNERFWVKFHFKTLQGHQFWTNAEAEQVVAKDRESSQRDLFEAIESGEFPKWRFCVQIMPEKDAEAYRWNVFDLTKVWPHKDYPLIEVGGGPLPARNDAGRKPVHIEGEVVSFAQVSIGGDGSLFQDLEEMLGLCLDEQAGADEVEGFVFGGRLPTVLGGAGFECDDFVQDVLPGALRDHWVAVFEVHTGQGRGSWRAACRLRSEPSASAEPRLCLWS